MPSATPNFRIETLFTDVTVNIRAVSIIPTAAEDKMLCGEAGPLLHLFDVSPGLILTRLATASVAGTQVRAVQYNPGNPIRCLVAYLSASLKQYLVVGSAISEASSLTLSDDFVAVEHFAGGSRALALTSSSSRVYVLDVSAASTL